MADDAKRVFVTVGTTSFDSLIKTICETKVCQAFVERGYSELLLQIGRGSFEPPVHQVVGLKVDFYRYKPSLTSDIEAASLVISHAGAGTCLEVLGAQRPLVVVINEELMGNHQIELAQKLCEDGHLLYTSCREFENVLRTMDTGSLQTFEPGKPERFSSYLDKVMGFS